MVDGRFETALLYCSEPAALPAALTALPLPSPAPTADFALAIHRAARVGAGDFALYLLSLDGQKMLTAHGFIPVTQASE